MTTQEIENIIALINQEVIPAMGCTEPIAVALGVAKAKEVLGEIPDHISVFLSANIIKNAMGVGIPGTGMIGLPIAIALGAIVGQSKYKLEVLKDLSENSLNEAKKYIAEKKISIHQKQNIQEKLYIEIICSAGKNSAKVIIEGGHTNFVYISKNQKVLFNQQNKTDKKEITATNVQLNMQKVYDFATTTPLSQIDFINKTAELNFAAAEHSLKNQYGHGLGKSILNNPEHLLGNGVYSQILYYTSAACDARMGGAAIAVMSNSGSGNQGIAATIPVYIYAQSIHATQEQTTRALMLSHLTVIYIKQYLGKLSALCGCVVAASGASCGITYLMGGNYKQICFSIKNMIANITGMICDGAKPSCSLKLATGISTALLSAMLAMENKCVTQLEGIICDDIDKCIENLALIGSKGMNETDRYVLDIMINKTK